MNKVPIATDDRRPYRPFHVAAVAALILGVFCLATVLMFRLPGSARASRRAADLQGTIQQHPQFSDVEVMALTDGELRVSAPEELPPDAKAELERLVARHAPGQAIRVFYLNSIPHAPASPNPK